MSDHEQTKMQLEVYLTEYKELKNEQIQRIGLRDNIVYATLAAAAAVFAFVMSKQVDPIALLGLAPATFVLGWIHLNNDVKSCAIGRYLRCTLRNRIHKLTGSEYPGILGWEIEVRSGRQRPWRKLMDCTASILAFAFPGFLALWIYWFRYHEGSLSWMLVAATVLEVILLGVLGLWIILSADVCWAGLSDVDT